MKCFSLLVFLFSISVTGFSQDENFTKDLAELSRQDISDLKAGILLVRLHTKKNGIEALRKAGNHKLADKKRAEITFKNNQIIHAFDTSFHFCEYYFFNSENSPQVLDQDYMNAGIFKVNGDAVNVKTFENRTVYISEISSIEQNSPATNARNINLERRDSTGVDKRYKMQSEKTFGFEALIIRDRYFNQLSKPFPYYQRTFAALKFLNLNKPPFVLVQIWNDRLNEYYTAVGY